METRSLGNLVVRLAVELAKYRADWKEAEAVTLDGAGKIEQATGGLDKVSGALGDTLKRQTGAFGQAAGGALEYAGAAQAATGASTAAVVGLGAVAAAAAAVGYAWYQGAKEQKALNDSLLLTGNYAGLVTGQLDQMAMSVASSIGGTVSASRDVLAGLAATGRFTVESMGEVGAAVQLVARYSGQTEAEVLKNFAGMADGAAKWAAKSNEAYHFLNVEQYRHIQQLEEQGRKQEAMALVADTLADHLKNNLTQNLGFLERAWYSVSAAASRAWAAMKDVGKDTPLERQIADAAQRLEAAKGGLAARSASGQDNIARMQEELRQLMRRKELLDANAQAQSAKAQADEAGIKADQQWGKIAEQNLSRREQMNKALDEARRVAAAAGASAEELAKVEARIRERYAEKGAGGVDKAAQELEKQRRLLAELSGVQADYMEKLQRLNAMRLAGSLSEERYVEAVEELIKKQPMAKALIKAQADETDRLAKASQAAAKAHESHVAELSKGIDKLQQEIDAQKRHNDTLGLSKVAVAELDAAKLEEMATSKELIAIRKYEKDLDEGLYDMRMREAAQLRELAALKREGALKEAGIDAAKATGKAWGETGEFIERSLLDAVQEGLRDGEHFGKAFFKSLESTAKTTILRFGVQLVGQGITGMVGQVMGGGNAAPGGGMGGNAGSLMNVASMFGAGGLGGSVMAGAGWLTGATSLTGSLSAATSLIMAPGGLLSGLGMMAGALGPIALGIAAISSLFGSKGGPKTESGYTSRPGLDTYAGFDGSEYTRDTSGAKPMVDALSASLAEAGKLFAVNVSKELSLFYAQDPEGDAQTILQVTSSHYNRGNRLGGVENVGREEEDLKKAIAEETTRVIFAEIAAADNLSDQLREIIGDTDAYTSSLEEITATMDRMTKATTERNALEETLFQLTATDLEKLTRTRELERAAIDPTNAALLEQVYVQQDLAAAAAHAADVQRERESLEVQLLRLQGNTEELRRRELLALDESNRALQEQIWALEDAAAAAQTASRDIGDALDMTGGISVNVGDIALAAATAAAEAASAWDKTAKSISDAMKKLRGEMIGFEAQNLAQVEAAFVLATAQASAGDQAAAAKLPELAQLLAQLRRQNAASAFEANLGTASVLASLGGVLNSIPSYDVGTPYVPRTGLALIHEGEEITPASVAQQRRGSADGVREELRQTREESRAQAAAIVRELADMRKRLDAWELQGMPAERAGA